MAGAGVIARPVDKREVSCSGSVQSAPGRASGLRGWCLGRLATSCSIGQPLADGTDNGLLGACSIVDAEGGAVAVPDANSSR